MKKQGNITHREEVKKSESVTDKGHQLLIRVISHMAHMLELKYMSLKITLINML